MQSRERSRALHLKKYPRKFSPRVQFHEPPFLPSHTLFTPESTRLENNTIAKQMLGHTYPDRAVYKLLNHQHISMTYSILHEKKVRSERVTQWSVSIIRAPPRFRNSGRSFYIIRRDTCTDYQNKKKYQYLYS